jgi:hypothetical protein
MGDRAGNRCSELQTFLGDLDIGLFGVRAPMVDENPSDMGDGIPLKIRGRYRPLSRRWIVTWPDGYGYLKSGLESWYVGRNTNASERN